MGLDVVTLSDDIAGIEQKSCFQATSSRQQAQFLAALDGLGATRGSKLVEGAAQWVLTVFSETKS